ncbi:MAG TPA: protein kinase, partial [Thermoanaerobaculia bacterium]|nr:protein kinase [Thermoanaerobaculia bacterium]
MASRRRERWRGSHGALMLSPGIKLGPYEILAPLGSGGMGEVYRARDTRLGREVAVKVLSDAVASNAVHLRRFEQEARSASALSDPNIVTVLDVGEQEGIHYFASELVEGGDLRSRLRGDGLPIRKVLEIAEQVASGLASAHERGITHRDLKPENILLTKSGMAKIADFGLAKLATAPAETPDAEISRMPTIDRLETTEGVVMGTVSYMSPEQAAGRKVDYRSDQFSFGLLLYEMLTRKLAFRRETKGETLAAILRDEPPPIADSNPLVPAPLCWIVERCLAKDPDERYSSTRDLAREIANVRRHISEATGSARTMAAVPRRKIRERLAWAGFAGAILLSAVLAIALARRAPKTPSAIISAILPPENLHFVTFALSPDGKRLAFTTREPGLWVRTLSAPAAQQVAEVEDAVWPFWSPDGKFIAYFAYRKKLLMKVDPSGGPPMTICASEGVPAGGTWNRDGTIVFAPAWNTTPLFRVAASGGKPEAVTKLGDSLHTTANVSPFFLPDGRHFLYTAWNAAGPNDDPANRIRVGSLDGKTAKVVAASTSEAVFADGYLLYVKENSLVAQKLNLARLEMEGEPIPVAPAPQEFSVSNGLLVTQPRVRPTPSQLTWFDRKGQSLGTVGTPAIYGDLRLSPDSRRIAVSVWDSSSSSASIRLYGADGVEFPFTRKAEYPVWSPAGDQIIFSSDRRKGLAVELWLKALDGSAEQIFLESPDESPDIWGAEDWSRDGRLLSVGKIPVVGKQIAQIWIVETGGSHTARPFVTDAREV